MAKIAVVDDNPDILFTIKSSMEFKDKSYEILGFTDPIRFLDAAENQKYDLIILDIMMPGRDGWDVCAMIKNSENMNKDTPIIFLTAKVDMQSKLLGASLAMDYITKPFDMDDLFYKIKNITCCVTNRKSEIIKQYLQDIINLGSTLSSRDFISLALSKMFKEREPKYEFLKYISIGSQVKTYDEMIEQYRQEELVKPINEIVNLIFFDVTKKTMPDKFGVKYKEYRSFGFDI